jgi:homoserine O-acetyltransferase
LADKAAVGDTLGMWQRFEVERYLEYHGVKLARRFDTNSYLSIGKAMDLHDVARGRGSLDRAMARVVAPTMAVGIWSDMLYPSYQQRQIHDMLTANGVPSEYVEIDSPHGHDAFLINSDQLAEPIERFLGTAAEFVG